MTTTTKKESVLFDEFFEMGYEDHVSPFLTPRSRRWGLNITLRASILASLFLVIAYLLEFTTDKMSIAYLFLLGVYFLAGIPALIESIEDIAQLEINIDVLMTLAAFSSVMIGSPFEGGMLLVLFALSGSMEDAVTDKAKGAISSLYKLAPSTTNVVDEVGELHERSVKDISVGTPILIKSGEIIPLDGEVIEGSSSLNLVHLTGENVPVTKTVGDQVPAGAENLEGVLTIRVTRSSTESTVARIIKLVTKAQEAKPKVQRWFDRVSKTYATVVIFLTAFFATALPYLLNIPFGGEDGSLYRSIAFLIAASPCALIIATPIAYLSAISTCARRGIILKGGVTLDAINLCQTIAFDKTGTLTKGELHLLGISPLESYPTLKDDFVIKVAYALERGAVHPVAKAIVKHAKECNLSPYPIYDFKALPGSGLEAKLKENGDEKEVFIGNAEFILPKLPPPMKNKLTALMEEYKKNGEILATLLLDEKVFLFRFEDTLRPLAKETIALLKKKQNIDILMLTGDHPESAKKIAHDLGIDHFYAELKPEDKLAHVGKLAEQTGLIMVGDGINDAPALARATVGISMGRGGSTSAIEAADVVFLHDNLEAIEWLLQKARQTKRIVLENLTLAASVILLATTPALLGYIPLWLAVILHEGGTVLVGLNALRLLEFERKK